MSRECCQVNPKQEAQAEIDNLLHKTSWRVFDTNQADLSAARGIAIREFLPKSGQPMQRCNDAVVHGMDRPRRNPGGVRGIGVPFPFIAEQCVISQEVERKVSLVCALETEVDGQMVWPHRLGESILMTAFPGRFASNN